MTSITLAIEDEIFERLQRVAAERGATVDTLLREALSHVAADGPESEGTATQKLEEARKGLLELIDNSDGKMAPGYKFDREELYER